MDKKLDDKNKNKENKEKEKGKEKEIIAEFKKDSMKIEHQNNVEALGKESNSKQKNFYIFYCSYGYIKVTLSDYKKNSQLLKFIQYREIPYKPEDCLKGTIYHKNVKKEINFKIKTFFNERGLYTIEKQPIFLSLHTAVQKIFSQIKEKKEEKESKNNEEIKEHITAQSQYRIFSCRKNIHELNPIRFIFENFIQENEILLYLPIKTLFFSEYVKGDCIVINREKNIASKITTDAPQYVLGNLFYTFGKHYFEINLLTEPIAASVIVGIATKKNPRDKYSYDVYNFYGIILSDGQKITSINGKQEKREYVKETFGINDIVGVMLEFKKEGLEVSFYKNKINLGIAYSKITNDKIFFPAVSLGFVGNKVQISNQIDFP